MSPPAQAVDVGPRRAPGCGPGGPLCPPENARPYALLQDPMGGGLRGVPRALFFLPLRPLPATSRPRSRPQPSFLPSKRTSARPTPTRCCTRRAWARPRRAESPAWCSAASCTIVLPPPRFPIPLPTLEVSPTTFVLACVSACGCVCVSCATDLTGVCVRACVRWEGKRRSPTETATAVFFLKT